MTRVELVRRMLGNSNGSENDAKNIICAADVMLQRGQSTSAWLVLKAGFALFKTPFELTTEQAFEGLKSFR